MRCINVLVTGAGGMLGRALPRWAPPHVRVLACTHAGLDVSDGDAVEDFVRLHTPDVIINAAVYLNADRAETEPERVRATNTEGPRHLALTARRSGIRVVQLSTAYVFDGTSPIPYKPDALANPISTYGRTKLDGELAVLTELPDRSVVLRASWLHAADSRAFVSRMLQKMRVNESFTAVADQIGTPTSAQSFAEMVWKIVDTPEIRGIHHWSDAGIASWYDVAVAVAEEGATLGLLPHDIEVTPIALVNRLGSAPRPRFSVLDTTSLFPLGIKAVHWRKRLREVLKEIRDA